MLGVYMLLGNVLLVNLLIAIFSSSLKKQKRTRQILKNKYKWFKRFHQILIYMMETSTKHSAIHFTEFVSKTFSRKECIRFEPYKDERNTFTKENRKCKCGRIQTEHHLSQEDDSFVTLSQENNRIKNFSTNAFGKIEFQIDGLGLPKPAKYIRMADDTPIEQVFKLMKEYWRMMDPHEPHLVISVAGGAKNLHLDGRRKERFNTGLISAAETTNAWIITGGCNFGSMKIVGEAIRERQFLLSTSERMTHAYRCIGVTKWGYIDDKEALVNVNVKEPYTAKYKVNPIFKLGQPGSLNPNHTHFFLVDDGTVGSFRGIQDFKSQLEHRISAPPFGSEPGLGIPVVLLLLEGGLDALYQVRVTVRQRIPVVVCAGTGRAADILAFTYNSFTKNSEGKRVVSDYHKGVIEDMLLLAYNKTFQGREEELRAKVSLVLDCCREQSLITVFDIDSNEQLDSAILVALMKGEGHSHRKEQLRLALKWNRVDLARRLFTSHIHIPPESLEEFMTEALVMDRVEFVKLLLMNGVVMKNYLTVGRLRELYNTCIYDQKNPLSYLSEILSSSKCNERTIKLWDIHLVLQHLVRRHKCYHYSDKPEQNCELSFLVGSDEHFDKPFRELFLWAVLMLRKEMAIYFWSEAHEALNLALAATSIYWHLRKSTSIHADLFLNKLVSLKSDFEQIAIEHLNLCYSMNREKAVELIEHPNGYWGNMTALNIALSCNDLEFISSPCCQHSITQTWMGGLATVSWWKVNLALFNPFLIWTYLKFRKDKATEKHPSFFKKARIFYSAPITKFFYDLYSYIAFLGIFSYVILFGFYETVGFVEFLLHIWILALALEEVREIVTYPSERKLQKPREWFQEYFWNKVDTVCMVLSLVGVLLRTTQQVIGSKTFWVHVEDIHLVMTISCTLCSVRLLKSYMVNLSFGPKLVMIKRMLVEVVLFLLILFIFILSYGVASQALLQRNREPFLGIFREVFYLPYWQLYGELNLDRIEDFYLNCSHEESRCNESPHAWLVPIMLGVYMLLGNVLLINLLIAVFSHVFEEVNKHSQEIWRYEMALIVAEFTRKPALIPPFVIMEHIYLVISWLCSKIRNRPCRVGDSNRLKSQLRKEEENFEHLSLFEREGRAKFLRSRSSDENSVEHLAKMYRKTTDEIKNSINEIMDVIQAGIVTQVPVISQRETPFLVTAPKPRLRSKPTTEQPGSSEENSLLYRELLSDEEPKDEEDLEEDEDISATETEKLRPKLNLIDQALMSRSSDENINHLMDLKSDMANLETKLTTLELTMADVVHHLETLSSKLNDIVKS